MTPSEKEMFVTFAALGEDSVREHLNGNLWKDVVKKASAKKWLQLQEAERKNRVHDMQNEREKQFTKAIKEMNAAVTNANRRAQKAYRFAMYACVVAFTALGLVCIQFLISKLT